MNILNTILIALMIQGAISNKTVNISPDTSSGRFSYIRTKEISSNGYDAFLYKGIPMYYVMKNVKYSQHIANLYAVIEGEKDTVVAALPEIFYPSNLSEVIYSFEKTSIIPSAFLDSINPKRTECNKVVFGQDFYPQRIVATPRKIIIKEGLKREKKIKANNLFADKCTVIFRGKKFDINNTLLSGLQTINMKRVIYGSHRGFHGMVTYSGISLHKIFETLEISPANPKKTLVYIKARDGYTAVFSWYELFNSRKSEQYLLAYKVNGKALGKGKGKYMIVAGGDFFADRSVKMVTEIIIDGI